MIIHAKDIKPGDILITPVYIHGMEVKCIEPLGDKIRVRYISDKVEYFDKNRLITRRD